MRWTANALARFQSRRSGEASSPDAPARRQRGGAFDLKNNQRKSSGPGDRPQPNELQIHMSVAAHLRARARPGVWWSHFPAGELRDERTAHKLKQMGTKPGVPDVLLLISGRLYGLELKRHDGRLSPEQRATHAG